MTTESVFTTKSTLYSYDCGNKGSVQNKAQTFLTCWPTISFPRMVLLQRISRGTYDKRRIL